MKANEQQAQIGISNKDTLKFQAINSIFGLVAQMLMVVIVDRLGRRPLLIAGNFTMCVTYIVSSALMAEFPPSINNEGAHWAFIVMTWLFNFSFNTMGSLCKCCLVYGKEQSIDMYS